MSRGIIALCVVGVMVVGLLMLGGCMIGTLNHEATLATLKKAKQTDNTSEFDNMVKKISQVAQVSKAQIESLKAVFVEYAEARTGKDSGAPIMKWIQETCPNIDTTTFLNLQNIITSSRDRWTMQQKELIDINREHELMYRVFPSNIVLAMFGRKLTDIQIVTSTRTGEAFKTGKDDDVSVFGK